MGNLRTSQASKKQSNAWNDGDEDNVKDNGTIAQCEVYSAGPV